jgi:hypothetical protein
VPALDGDATGHSPAARVEGLVADGAGHAFDFQTDNALRCPAKVYVRCSYKILHMSRLLVPTHRGAMALGGGLCNVHTRYQAR